MATKPAWASTNPSSGSGNGAVSVGGAVHTGRLQRTGTLTYKATGVNDIEQGITQEGKPEFVSINDTSVAKAGGTATLTGTSNSSKLTFSLGNGSIVISLPGSYTAGGASTNNGANIAGDPGASAQYNFSIEITVPANSTIAAISKQVIVTANGGQQATGTISQPAGDPTLSVSTPSIIIPADGTPVSVTVTSNTNWTVS